VVISVSVKTPLESSMVTASSPSPASTTMWSNLSRLTLVTRPLPTTSTRLESPAASRSTIVSAPPRACDGQRAVLVLGLDLLLRGGSSRENQRNRAYASHDHQPSHDRL